ncbi:hypothetical protein [Campylobacter mucosalis]|uniref:Uncharacterized protein n=1 Tax=Campylobacter mucosalis CCUG 21559 TaxID=1032067 RepID=A0A6G5QES8_9BACT|nr:hypothetical protein [Campylobacter mucosalis]QCD44124.1 hypothetical protein CMUC_0310 [Campylobacter mucosalis CCUG 21559]QCD44713.1 hypothetical protein CMUC_0924 [Campylobacter mucosalis CCUG 21559]
MFKILMNFLPNLFKSNAIIYVLWCFCIVVGFVLNKQLNIANEKIGIYKLENELIRSSLTTCNAKIDEQNAKFKELEAKKPNLAKITANIKAKQSVKAPKNSECVEIKGYYERATQDMLNKLKENRQ